uniref:Uncharacterized protein n=1 Tax=viral metagenome TaxID=1070528 RepID=A0A6M3J1J4_9ZZZZ
MEMKKQYLKEYSPMNKLRCKDCGNDTEFIVEVRQRWIIDSLLNKGAQLSTEIIYYCPRCTLTVNSEKTKKTPLQK